MFPFVAGKSRQAGDMLHSAIFGTQACLEQPIANLERLRDAIALVDLDAAAHLRLCFTPTSRREAAASRVLTKHETFTHAYASVCACFSVCKCVRVYLGACM
jgi:hypothetical protein